MTNSGETSSTASNAGVAYAQLLNSVEDFFEIDRQAAADLVKLSTRILHLDPGSMAHVGRLHDGSYIIFK